MRDAIRGLAGSGLAMLAVLGAPAPAAGQSTEWYEMSSRRQTDGIETLDLDVEYVAGHLTVETIEPGLLYRFDLRYDASRFEPVREWEAAGGEGRLSLRFKGDEDIEFGNLENVDSDDFGSLAIGLSRDVPSRLSLNVAAAEARLDLGGAALRDLVYRTGASETSLAFDTPNPVRMERLELAAGAAEFTASGLGNARFDRLSFSGAVGDVRLGFEGDWEGSAEADVNMGLGALRLVFPRDLGVKISKSSLLSSFDADGFTEVDGAYLTPNWETAENRLTMSIRAGFGDIDVAFVD